MHLKLLNPLLKCGQKGGVCSAAVPHFPPCLALKNPFQLGKTLAAFTLEIPLETEKHLAYRSGNFGRDI